MSETPRTDELLATNRAHYMAFDLAKKLELELQKSNARIRELEAQLKPKKPDTLLEDPWHLDLCVSLPRPLQTPQCLEAAKRWLQFKRESKKPYKSRMGLIQTCTKWAREFTPATFPAAVDQSIENNWSGLFPVVDAKTRTQTGKPKQPGMTFNQFGMQVPETMKDVTKIPFGFWDSVGKSDQVKAKDAGLERDHVHRDYSHLWG